MNKTLLFILVPCIVAFCVAQAVYPGYGGYGYGTGYPYAAYAGYAAQQRRVSNNGGLLIGGLLFFILFVFLSNLTGQIIG